MEAVINKLYTERTNKPVSFAFHSVKTFTERSLNATETLTSVC